MAIGLTVVMTAPRQQTGTVSNASARAAACCVPSTPACSYRAAAGTTARSSVVDSQLTSPIACVRPDSAGVPEGHLAVPTIGGWITSRLEAAKERGLADLQHLKYVTDS